MSTEEVKTEETKHVIDPDAKILRKHLEAAIEWAQASKDLQEAVKLNGFAPVAYAQEYWAGEMGEWEGKEPSCGTAFCVHGAAHLLARGILPGGRPHHEDYSDISPANRDMVVQLMLEPDSTPAQMKAALTADLTNLKLAVETFTAVNKNDQWIIDQVGRHVEMKQLGVALLASGVPAKRVISRAVYASHTSYSQVAEMLEYFVAAGHVDRGEAITIIRDSWGYLEPFQQLLERFYEQERAEELANEESGDAEA